MTKRIQYLPPGSPSNELVAHYNDVCDAINELYEDYYAEKKMREKYPALQKAWEHYQFTKNLVSEPD